LDLINALILGVVEGFSEFLPISSTGHLIVLSKYLSINQSEFHKSFEIIIQFSAILAVVTLYFKDLFKISNIIKLSVAFIPTGIVGFLFYDFILALFTSSISAIMFIIGGFVLIIMDIFMTKKKDYHKDIEDISLKESFFIGLVQVLSLIPGTSRSGASILGASLVKMDKVSASKFSFLLGVPTILIASLYESYKNYDIIANIENVNFLLVGFLSSYVMALLSLKLMLGIIKNIGFSVFGVYRIIFGIFLLI